MNPVYCAPLPSATDESARRFSSQKRSMHHTTRTRFCTLHASTLQRISRKKSVCSVHTTLELLPSLATRSTILVNWCVVDHSCRIRSRVLVANASDHSSCILSWTRLMVPRMSGSRSCCSRSTRAISASSRHSPLSSPKRFVSIIILGCQSMSN